MSHQDQHHNQHEDQHEDRYRVTTTYDRTVEVEASSADDARLAAEARVVIQLRAEGARFAPSRVRAVYVRKLAA